MCILLYRRKRKVELFYFLKAKLDREVLRNFFARISFPIHFAGNTFSLLAISTVKIFTYNDTRIVSHLKVDKSFRATLLLWARLFSPRENFREGGNSKKRGRRRGGGEKCSLIKRVQIALKYSVSHLCSVLKLFTTTTDNGAIGKEGK